MLNLEKSSTPVRANASPGPRFLNRFTVADVSVEVEGDCPEDASLNTSLQTFQDFDKSPDICIQVKRTATLNAPAHRPVFDSGSIWRLCESDQSFQFDFWAPAAGASPYRRLLINKDFNRATIQINEECFENFPQARDPLNYPLDELLIMHRLTQEHAVELHGSGIVRANGVGNLFVGHSGAGKSTTTRLWTSREEVEVLSDDRIVVRRDEVKRTGACVAEEILRSAQGDSAFRDDSATRDGITQAGSSSEVDVLRFAQDDKGGAQNDNAATGMRMYGTPWHGEAMFASPNSAPLSRIFVLEHGLGNVITRLSKSQAVGELFARAFVPFHRHEYVESALSFLEELADSVPVYRYSFEPDDRAVDKILAFND